MRLFVSVYVMIPTVVYSEKSLYQKILYHNMASLTWEEQEWPDESFGSYLKRYIEYQQHPCEAQKRYIACNMLDSYYKQYPGIDNDVLTDVTTWRDINLFCGKQHKHIYLASIVDRTYTEIGKVSLFGMLATPQTDILLLQKRQSIVCELLENKKLYQQLNYIFTEIADTENMILSFWSLWGNDPLFNAAKKYYFSFPLLKTVTHALNTNQLLLEINNKIGHNRRFVLFITSVLAAAVLPAYGIMCLLGIECPQFVSIVVEKLRGAGGRMLSLFSLVDNRFVLAGTSITAGAYCALNCQDEYSCAFDHMLLDDLLHKKMVIVARYVRAVKKLKRVIDNNYVLYNVLEKNEHLSHFFSSNIKSVKLLIRLLEQLTDTKKTNMFFLQGCVLATYYLLHEIKNELLPILVSVGEVDMYLSIARLYKEFEDKRVHISFAEFKNADKPFIELENFWNPFIEDSNVIPSSIIFGGDMPQNGIITGPNAAGKSTILHAIVINLILAQTMGIAPANKIIITPFAKIASYCNVTDDIAAGNSLFKAQVIRAQRLINNIVSLSKDAFSFVAVDEMFNGTSEFEGKSIAYAVTQRFGTFSNSVCLIATHFLELTQLAAHTANCFANYRVCVEKMVDGSLCYPFVLEEGVSDQHVALDIVRNQGLEHAIIDKAQEFMSKMLKNHELAMD